MQFQRVVQAAEAIATQVDRDVRVAERAQAAVDRGGHVGLEGARDFVLAPLEPRDDAVVARGVWRGWPRGCVGTSIRPAGRRPGGVAVLFFGPPPVGGDWGKAS